MFHEKLRQIRVLQQLKQTDLAKQLDVKNTTISNWEKGVSTPDLKSFKDLCKLLDVTADYLLDLEATSLTSKEQHMINQFQKLDDYGKMAVETTLQLEYKRVMNSQEESHFKSFEDAYDYLKQYPMYAMKGLDIESMNQDELIEFANDQYLMDQKAMKLFK